MPARSFDEYVGRLPRGSAGHGKTADKGNGAIYWSEARERWVGAVTVGYTPQGQEDDRCEPTAAASLR